MRGDGDGDGEVRPDYGKMSLPELEAREKQARDTFRETFGDLQGRLNDEGERVGEAARRAREVLFRADELVRRHHRVVLAGSVGIGLALGYRRRRVVAERTPSERDAEYVLVRRDRSRASPFRAAAAKLAGMAAAEALQTAAQLLSERRQEAHPEPPPGYDPVGGKPIAEEDVRMNG